MISRSSRAFIIPPRFVPWTRAPYQTLGQARFHAGRVIRPRTVITVSTPPTVSDTATFATSAASVVRRPSNQSAT